MATFKKEIAMLNEPWTEKPSVIPHVTRGWFWVVMIFVAYIALILALPALFLSPHDLPY